ncbi:MAG: hypothetical protein JO032_13595 [Alphaproteobacteria bacterium]|nr:hypothetical protein [Alphaproteobacteria bacterium]MBV9553811.1 hypothetical protein [Alphaproteobacteria bacterium]
MQSRTVIEREEAAAGPASDYLVVGRDEPDPPGIGARIVYGLQIVVILLIALLSFAIFWVVGLLLNIF